jgi:hypothetical protein
MRTFVLFALALTGAAVIADAASAGPFRRNRGAYSNSSYATGGSPCCDSAATAGYPGAYQGAYAGPYSNGTSYMVPGANGQYYPSTAGQTVNGKAAMIQTTDGHTYTLGADGSYYPAAAGMNMSTMGGFTSQPYSNTSYYGSPYYGTRYYNGRGYSSYYPSGVYPAGYYGSPYNGVYPAGGPLTMPGVNIGGPGGITIVPSPMPPNK